MSLVTNPQADCHWSSALEFASGDVPGQMAANSHGLIDKCAAPFFCRGAARPVPAGAGVAAVAAVAALPQAELGPRWEAGEGADSDLLMPRAFGPALTISARFASCQVQPCANACNDRRAKHVRGLCATIFAACGQVWWLHVMHSFHRMSHRSDGFPGSCEGTAPTSWH
jgi:hypothetical protein